MPTGARDNLYVEVDAEIERLRSLSTRTGKEPTETAVVLPHPIVSPAEAAEPTAPASINPGQILDNLQRLTLALRTSGERIAAAEERARQAEARAMEAERWLRRLHQAVQDAMRLNKVS